MKRIFQTRLRMMSYCWWNDKPMRLKKYGRYIDYTTAPSDEWGLDTGNICFEETQMFASSIIICVVVFVYTFIRHQWLMQRITKNV